MVGNEEEEKHVLGELLQSLFQLRGTDKNELTKSDTF